jgi:hypothetical protein
MKINLMKINPMKTTLFAVAFFCFLCATTAFAQNAPVLPNAAQPMQILDHPQHASQHAMAQESSLFGSSPYGYAQGEVPLAELGSIAYQTPLGDVARTYRKEHVIVPKAAKVSENQ